MLYYATYMQLLGYQYYAVQLVDHKIHIKNDLKCVEWSDLSTPNQSN